MRVLITQMAADAASSATALKARGHQVLAIPLVTAERTPPPKINLAGAQGFIVINGEGARALADHIGVRTFPVFADSEVTAAELRRLGFTHIETAKDDAADLARLVERRITPANGALIYACSTSAPINLPTMLGNMGFAVRPLPFYALKRVENIPSELRTALQSRSIDAALFLSADEARAFVALVQKAEVEPLVSSLATVAATPVVAAPLRALKLGGISVPPSSALDAVFGALDIKLVDRVAEARAAREALAREQAERDRAEMEKVEQERAERERVAQEIAAREQAARMRAEEDRAAREAEKVETERRRAAARAAELVKAAEEKAERERIAAQKAAADQAERERIAMERAQQELAERERLLREKTERDRIAAEKAAAEKVERERLAAERAERQRIAQEEIARAKSEHERLALVRAERDRLERERLAKEQVERERIAAQKAVADKAERERLALEKAERDRIAREQDMAEAAERVRAAKEQAERDRMERERLAQERADQDRAAQAIAAAERAENDRLKQEQAERDRVERERLAQEKAERDRIAREQVMAEAAERVRADKEQAERDRMERERLAQERADQDRAAQEIAAAEKAENDRLKQEQAERDRVERERLAQEKAERDRIAREQVMAEAAERARAAKEQAERDRMERERMAAARAEEKAARAQAKQDAAERAKADKAERRQVAQELEAQMKAERAQLRVGWSLRLRTWMDRIRAATPTADLALPSWQATAPDALKPTILAQEAVKLSAPPTKAEGAGRPQETSEPVPPQTATASITVAEINPSVTMRASAAPVIGHNSEPVPGTSGPQAKEQPPVPQSVSETVSEAPSEAVPSEDSSAPVAATRGGGRAARLLAEDAADQRAKDQRFKYLGHSEAAAPEPEPAERRGAFAAQENADDANLGQPSRGGFGRALTLLVVLVIMAAAVFGTASWWVPRVKEIVFRAPSANQPAVSADSIQTEIATLKARVASLEQKAVNGVTIDALNATKQELLQRLAASDAGVGAGVGPAGNGEAVTSLSDSLSSQARQLAAVSARLATLEAAIGNSARLEDLNKRLNMLEGRSAEANSVLALSDRVTTLESSARRTMLEQSTNVAFLMAVVQWREAMLAGHPFALELETVKTLAARAGSPTFDDSDFGDSAARGIPTLPELQRRFGPTAAAAMRAGAIPDDTSAWYRRILDRILSIVTIRRLDGNAAGTSVSAILARAERRLAEGDLAAAVAEMNGLRTDAAKAVVPWLAEAQARVAAEKAAADATKKAISTIARTDDQPAPTSKGR